MNAFCNGTTMSIIHFALVLAVHVEQNVILLKVVFIALSFSARTRLHLSNSVTILYQSALNIGLGTDHKGAGAQFYVECLNNF